MCTRTSSSYLLYHRCRSRARLLLVSLQTTHLSCPDRVSLLSYHLCIYKQKPYVGAVLSSHRLCMNIFFFLSDSWLAVFHFVGQEHADARYAGTPTVSACDCARAIDSCVSRPIRDARIWDSHSLASQVAHVLLMLFILARPLLVKIPRACMCGLV